MTEKTVEEGRVYVFQAANDEVCTMWVNRIIKMWTWAKMSEKNNSLDKRRTAVEQIKYRKTEELKASLQAAQDLGF